MKFKESIKGCFYVEPGRNVVTGQAILLVSNGTKRLMAAVPATRSDWDEEVRRGGNECARTCEIFRDTTGKLWIYWRDEEIDVDYLSPAEVL